MFKSKNQVRCFKTTDPLIFADRNTMAILGNRVRVLESIEQLHKQEKLREAELEAELAKPNPNQQRIYKLNEILYDINSSLRRANQR